MEQERDKAEWQRTSWLAAAIVTHLVGEKVEPRDLLPSVWPKQRKKSKKMTEKAKAKQLAELKKSLNIE